MPLTITIQYQNALRLWRIRWLLGWPYSQMAD
jgi:hypothetical protein